MKILSDRIKRIEESGIRKVFALAAKNRGEYLNLSIGQPHFAAPASLKAALKTAVDADANAYTATAGREKLRARIAEKLNKENRIKARAENIIITGGTAGAIFLLFSCIFNPGDEVILPDPYFVLYKQVLNFLGVKIVFWDTYPDFHLDCGKLDKLITAKTKAIIINTPNNPTGAVYGKSELEKLAEAARRYGLLVVSDEIYEKFDYDKKFFSIGSIYENTITLNGFSKSLSVTGWRVGYAHGPQAIIEAMNKLQQYSFVCAPSMAQAALEKAMPADIGKYLREYKEKRDFVYENLQAKYILKKPEGAFYAFIKYPDKRQDFAQELLAHKILSVPGAVFSEKNTHFRISFAVSQEILEKAIAILKKL